MAAGTAPIFPDSPMTWRGTVSVANTNRDGSTGTYVEIIPDAVDGSIVEAIHVKAEGTTTSGSVRFFLNDGTTRELLGEVIVTANTPGAAIATFEATLVPDNTDWMELLLAGGTPGYSVDASTHNAETFHISAVGGEY